MKAPERNGILIGFLVLLVCPVLPGQGADRRPEDVRRRMRTPFFRDVAGEVGLAEFASMRAMCGDLDGDGWVDFVLHVHGPRFSPGRIRVLMSRSNGKGGRMFVDQTKTAGFSGGATEAAVARLSDFAVVGDVDNDGDLDLFSATTGDWETPRPDPKSGRPMMNEQGKPVPANSDPGDRNRIFLNDGHGRFLAAADSGPGARAESTCAAIFFDADRDGMLDLMVGNWYRYYGFSLECYPDRLFRGKGDGAFVDITTKAGLGTVPQPERKDSSRPTYGLAHCDIDGDGLEDILVCSYGRQWNRLWRNNGDGTFTDIAPAVGFDGDSERSGIYPKGIARKQERRFRANGNTFEAACGDVDGDGRVDVFLAEIAHWWAGPSSDRSALLIQNKTPEGFRFERTRRGIERTHQTPQWNEGDIYATWFDFDNDGKLDLLLASSDYPDKQVLRLFRQGSTGRFEDVTGRAGFSWRNSTQPTVADYDRDGDLDILVGNTFRRLPKEMRVGMTRRVALFENQVGNQNNWLSLRLEGRGKGGSNRSAIGARVVVWAGGRRQMRDVRGGQGHAGHQDELVCHFGLGTASQVDRLEIRWPRSGERLQTFQNVAVNRRLHIREGEEHLREDRPKAPR